MVGCLEQCIKHLPANSSKRVAHGGVDDNYLLLTAVGGNGAGNRLTALNLVYWEGNYLTSGVTQIEMDLNNLGQSDLALRLMFEKIRLVVPLPMIAFSADPVLGAQASGWVHVVFGRTAARL